MTTPSMNTDGGGDEGDATSETEPPPNRDGIDFDTIFNNREPGGTKRDRGR